MVPSEIKIEILVKCDPQGILGSKGLIDDLEYIYIYVY